MRIAVCDSGLGGLDIAARLYQKGGEGELFYFNVWPDPDRGFGKMPPEERCIVWEKAFDSILGYSPDLLIIACNTLSVVHRRSSRYGSPRVKVLDIVDAAVGVTGDFLRANPRQKLLILGTPETVNSQCYRNMLIEEGIAPERIAGTPCPGVATAIEKDPAGEEVRALIRSYAEESRQLWGQDLSGYALGLCCTHFGYVPEVWKEYFSPYCLLDPNERILEGTSFPEGENGIPVKVISKIPIPESKQNAMRPFFSGRTPALADALKDYSLIPDLF